MLKISSQQVRQFQSVATDDFAVRLLSFLERVSPNKRIQHDKRLPTVKDLILAAHEWDFRTEHHVAIYALAQWLQGITLERDHAEVRTLLEDQSFTLDEKSQWLERWVQAHGTKRNHSAGLA